MRQFLTSIENIALNLIFDWLGSRDSNRTYAEYMQIAARISSIEACHAYINQRLQEYKNQKILLLARSVILSLDIRAFGTSHFRHHFARDCPNRADREWNARGASPKTAEKRLNLLLL